MLERHSNLYVDIAARIGELGRQPYSARRFFLRWRDRILFGTDSAVDLDTCRIYYRFLETFDESFDYAAGAGAAPGTLADLTVSACRRRCCAWSMPTTRDVSWAWTAQR